jgi:hypothetical protein
MQCLPYSSLHGTVCSDVVVAVNFSAVMDQRHKLFVCQTGYFGNIISGEMNMLLDSSCNLSLPA